MKIIFKKISLHPIIGTYDWERKVRQEVLINLEIELHNESAVKTDDLEDTLDYEFLLKTLRERIENKKFYLIERLAGEIWDILTTDSRISGAVIEVIKPYALNGCDSVSINYSVRR